MEKGKKYMSWGMLMILVAVSTAFARVNEVGMSSVLPLYQADLGLNSAQAAMGLSIIYIGFAIFNLMGGSICEKIGIKRTYTIALIFIAVGLLVNFVAYSYAIFLIGRIIFSVGMGLSVPFYSGATRAWMNKNQQYIMNSVNTLYPQLGSILAFLFLVALSNALGSWRAGLGIWGIATIVVLIIWIAMPEPKIVKIEDEGYKEDKLTMWQVFREAWSYRTTKAMAFAMFCSFSNFTTYNTFNTTYQSLVPGVDLQTASTLSALNPVFAIVGAFVCMFWIKWRGTRKETSIAGFLITGLGTLMTTLFVGTPLGNIGIGVFGFGMAVRMPGIYAMCVELEDAKPSVCAACGGVITGIGAFAAFAMPLIAGAVVDAMGGQTLENLRIVLALSSIFTVLGAICICFCKENGPAARRKRAALAAKGQATCSN